MLIHSYHSNAGNNKQIIWIIQLLQKSSWDLTRLGFRGCGLLQLKPEANNILHFLPIRFCFINVYTYPNPKHTPYNSAKTIIVVVQCDKNYATL